MSLVGGTLLLTNQRLIFEPIMVKGLALLSSVTNAASSLMEHYIALTDIAGVFATEKYPQIQIDLFSADSRYYTIAASRFSPIWSEKNYPARDDAVERIYKAVTEAG